MRVIRSGLSVLCWAVAVVAAIVTIPTFWFATHVADEDGYVEFTSEFVTDVQLRNALVTQVADETVRVGGLPAAAKPLVDRALRALVNDLARDRGFVRAWEESQRRSHRLSLGAEAKTDRLTVDLGPIATYIVDRVEKDLSVRVEVPNTLRVPIHDVNDREVLDQVAKTPDRSRLGLLVVGMASLLCLLFARRRVNALVGLGAGAVITAGVLLAGTRVALPEVLDRTPARTPFAREMRDLLVDRASGSLNEWLLWIAIVGGVLLVISALGRALPGR